MNKFLKEFKDRGFFYQCTNEEELSNLLNEEKIKKPLSKKILFENMRDHTVTIDYIGEDYTFQ